MKNKQTKIILAVLVLAILGALGAYRFLAPQPSAGEKNITVRVDHLVGEDKIFTYATDAEFLRGALEEQDLVAGREDQYGLWVLTIDGETVDEAQQQWWGYTVNGEVGQYGVETQPVADGDEFTFTLNVGW